MKKFIFLSCLILLISACTTRFDGNYDASKNNQQTFNVDLANCKLTYPADSYAIKNCMYAKGWKPGN